MGMELNYYDRLLIEMDKGVNDKKINYLKKFIADEVYMWESDAFDDEKYKIVFEYVDVHTDGHVVIFEVEVKGVVTAKFLNVYGEIEYEPNIDLKEFGEFYSYIEPNTPWVRIIRETTQEKAEDICQKLGIPSYDVLVSIKYLHHNDKTDQLQEQEENFKLNKSIFLKFIETAFKHFSPAIILIIEINSNIRVVLFKNRDEGFITSVDSLNSYFGVECEYQVNYSMKHEKFEKYEDLLFDSAKDYKSYFIASKSGRTDSKNLGELLDKMGII
jgi:hypothetical protein